MRKTTRSKPSATTPKKSIGSLPPGTLVQMTDRAYTVQSDGSWKRCAMIDKKAVFEEEPIESNP